MKLLFVFLGAIGIIILGARGTYKSVWNQFFPNEQITTTPTSTAGQTGSSASSGGSSYNPTGGQPGQTPTTPVQVGQQAANNTKKAISSFLGGGSNTQPSTPIQVPPGKKGVISTGVPSWWPSWLPYPSWFPHPGEGATGQII